MLKYKNKKVPLGYRDTDLEQRILLNTYKNKGIREGEARGIEKGKEQKSLETARYLLS